MVFGFFTKKQQTQTDLSVPEDVPLPESPRPSSENAVQDGKDVSQQPEIHTQVEQLQLRTPSPSVVDSVSAAQATRYPSEVPSIGLGPEATRPPVEPTPESLSTLISSVPAKIVHDYTLAQLPTTTQPTLDALASFFALLTPPPKLHCVRCHKDFVEVENDDRSCLVPHDDDSAEVERVGRTGHERRTKEGTEYETLWGCCGKTTEGDGSQGPPDGWCYEGKHTIDIKRARFRADSTIHDDKLVSCLRLNCHGIRSRMPRASSSRKRARQTYKEESSEEEDESEGEADSGVDEIVGKTKEVGAKKKGKGKQKESLKAKEKPKEKDNDDMDVDEEDDQASKAGSTSTPAGTAKRPRGRPRKSLTSNPTTTPDSAAKVPAKRRGRPPKTKATVDDSEPESTRGRKSANTSPVRSLIERPRTRSLSRTRPESSASPVAFKPAHKKSLSKTKTKTKMAEVIAGGEDGDSDEADDEQPKKRRKIVA